MADLPEMVAAVDLGSNSFHMLVASMMGGEMRVVDRIRERVALAAGLDRERRLTEEAQARALACLRRFGQRLKHMPAGSVRAAGTNTLRVARNAAAFLERAERTIGHPIEVVSGREEARLIYLGVAHSLEDDAGRRLVIDIGGGSTECIIGEQLDTVCADSLFMGSVSWSLRFFPGGRIGAGAMRDAEMAARIELESIEQPYRARGFTTCIGSSGTVRAIEEIARANGWSKDGIGSKALSKLRKAVLDAGHEDRLTRIDGVREDRAPVLAGGLAILLAAFDAFRIEHMQAATGALREGLIYDLWGRLHQEDVRHRTIRGMVERWDVDREQAARVERTALLLFGDVAEAWGIDRETGRRFLSWAARLHEIGLSIAYAGYHKHGAYVAANADMAGFSRQDQALLAALIGAHRRKIGEAAFAAVAPARGELAMRLAIVLRLAVRLNRSRTDHQDAPGLALRARGERIDLRLDGDWLEAHPLTRADLEEERGFLAGVGVSLAVVSKA